MHPSFSVPQPTVFPYFANTLGSGSSSLSSSFQLSFVNPNDALNYQQLFLQNVPSLNQRISAAAAKQVLLQTGLPNQTLAKIWTLADCSKLGALSFPEFCFAMTLSKLALESSPSSLPMMVSPLIQQEIFNVNHQLGVLVATHPPIEPKSKPTLLQSSSSASLTPSLASSTSLPSISSLPSSLPLNRSISSSNLPASSTLQGIMASLPSNFATTNGATTTSSSSSSSIENSTSWVISYDERQKYLTLFKAWDQAQVGYLTGEQCRTIFMTSGLASNVLQHIWSLSDIHQLGKLNFDEFCIAMHLIYKKLNFIDLPTTLPPTLLPIAQKDLSSSVAVAKQLALDHLYKEKQEQASAHVPSWRRPPTETVVTTSFTSKPTLPMKQEDVVATTPYVSKYRRKTQADISSPSKAEAAPSFPTISKQQLLQKIELAKTKCQASSSFPSLSSSSLQDAIQILETKLDQYQQYHTKPSSITLDQVKQTYSIWIEKHLELFKIRDAKEYNYPPLPEEASLEMSQLVSLVGSETQITSTDSEEMQRKKKAAAILAQRMAKLNPKPILTQEQEQAQRRIQSEKQRLHSLMEQQLRSLTEMEELKLQAHKSFETKKSEIELTLKNAKSLLQDLKASTTTSTTTSNVTPSALLQASFREKSLHLDPIHSTNSSFPSPFSSSFNSSALNASPKKEVQSSSPSAAFQERASRLDAFFQSLKPSSSSPLSAIPPPPPPPPPLSSSKFTTSTPSAPSNPPQTFFTASNLSEPKLASDKTNADLPFAERIANFSKIFPSRTSEPPASDKKNLDAPFFKLGSSTSEAIDEPLSQPMPPSPSMVSQTQDNLNPILLVSSSSQPSSTASSTFSSNSISASDTKHVITSSESCSLDVLSTSKTTSVAPSSFHSQTSPTSKDTLSPPEPSSIPHSPQCSDSDTSSIATSSSHLSSSPSLSPTSLKRISSLEPQLPPSISNSTFSPILSSFQATSNAQSTMFPSHSLPSSNNTSSSSSTFPDSPILNRSNPFDDVFTPSLNPSTHSNVVPSPPFSSSSLMDSNSASLSNPFASPASSPHSSPSPPSLSTLPVVVFQAKALCDFEAPDATCLSFPKNAILDILHAEREDWVYGVLDSSLRGWVPRTYLCPIHILGLGHILQSYQPNTQDELLVHQRDTVEILEMVHSDWWLVKKGSRLGFVPADHIQTDLKYVSNEASDSLPMPLGTDTSHESPIAFEEEAATDQVKRTEALKELRKTEASFVKDLRTVKKVYILPLTSHPLCTKELLDRLFVNWNTLLDYHQCFLTDLKSNAIMVSGILERHLSEAMELYIEYCSNQKKAILKFTEIINKANELTDFFNQARMDSRCSAMDLASFLLKPVQRITRYPLLIKQILHYTSEKHDEHKGLMRALQIAEKLLQSVNDAARAEEDQIIFAEVLGKVDLKFKDNTLDLSSQTKSIGKRHFITHGSLSKAKSGRKLFAYLFNDLLLLCEERKSERNYPYQLYRAPLLLQDLEVTIDPERKDVFYLHPSKTSLNAEAFHNVKPIGLRAPFNGRHHWVNQIQSACKVFSKENKLNSLSLPSLAIGTLCITVLEGRCVGDLKQYGSSGLLNFLCEVSLSGQTLRTRAIRGTSFPKWKESLMFSVYSLDAVVRLVLFNAYDKYSQEEYLGTSEFFLHVLEYYGDKEVLQEMPLQNGIQGSLKVKLQYRSFASHT